MTFILPRPIPLVSGFPVRFQTARVPFGGVIHRFGERSGKIRVEVNHSPDVVVELSDQAHVPAEIVWDFGLMVLVDLID